MQSVHVVNPKSMVSLDNCFSEAGSVAWDLRLEIAKTLQAKVSDKDALFLGFFVLSSVDKGLNLCLDRLRRMVACQSREWSKEKFRAAL